VQTFKAIFKMALVSVSKLRSFEARLDLNYQTQAHHFRRFNLFPTIKVIIK